MKTRLLLMGAAWLLFTALPARADDMVLAINPSSQTVYSEFPLDVSLVVSRLDFKSLGAFDLDVQYDPTFLKFQTAALGDPVLGDQLNVDGLGTLGSVDGSMFGTVNLFEVSLNLSTDLNSLQATDFTLGTLKFSTLKLGTTDIDISINAMGDASGDPLAVTVLNGSATIVPEPCSISLLGLVACFAVRKCHSATKKG